MKDGPVGPTYTTKNKATAIKNRMLTNGRSEDFFMRFQCNNIGSDWLEKIDIRIRGFEGGPDSSHNPNFTTVFLLPPLLLLLFFFFFVLFLPFS